MKASRSFVRTLHMGILTLLLSGCGLADFSDDSWKDDDQAADLDGIYRTTVFGYCSSLDVEISISRVEENVLDLTLSIEQDQETTYRLRFDIDTYVFAPDGFDIPRGIIAAYPGWDQNWEVFLLPRPSRGLPYTLVQTQGGRISSTSVAVPSSYTGKDWVLTGATDPSGDRLAEFEASHTSLSFRLAEDRSFTLRTASGPSGPQLVRGSYRVEGQETVFLTVDTGLSTGPLLNSYSFTCPSEDQTTLLGPSDLFNSTLGTDFLGRVHLTFQSQD